MFTFRYVLDIVFALREQHVAELARQMATKIVGELGAVADWLNGGNRLELSAACRRRFL